jgi:hypothetical protein
MLHEFAGGYHGVGDLRRGEGTGKSFRVYLLLPHIDRLPGG